MSAVYYFLLRDPHSVLFGEFAVVGHTLAITLVALVGFVSDLVVLVSQVFLLGAPLFLNPSNLGCHVPTLCSCRVPVQFFGVDVFAGSMRRYLRLVGGTRPPALNTAKAHPV